MISPRILPLAALAALCMATAPARAALSLVYGTDFSYTDGGLIGQDSWAITGASVVNPVTVASGAVTLTTNGQDVNRPFTPAITSGSVFLSAVITVSTAQATGDYFLHLGDGGASNFYGRLYAKSSGTGYVLALATSSGAAVNYGTTVLTLGEPATVLIRYDMVPGAANDTGALYFNPTSEDGSLDTPYVAATTIGTDATSISSLNLRQGGSSSAPTVTITSASVSVPEASSALLGLLAGLGLMTRRRR